MATASESVEKVNDGPVRHIIVSEQRTTQAQKIYKCKWTIHKFYCKASGNRNLPSAVFNVAYGSKISTIVLSISGKCGQRKCILQIPNSLLGIIAQAKLGTEKDGIKECMYMNLDSSATNIFEKSLSIYSKQLASSICTLCNGGCTIICEITFCRYVTNKTLTLVNELAETQENSDTNFALFESKMHSDVTFLFSEKELPAHKCILASRNKVFAAMFENEMKEVKSNQVIIEDIDYEVFEDLLRFIYTGEVLHLKEFTRQLLDASEKYDVQLLKSMCIEEMAQNISIENATETLLLAYLYRSEGLKDVAANFINANRENVANTEGWESFIDNHPRLLAKLFVFVSM